MSSQVCLDEMLVAPCGFYCGICSLFSRQRCSGCEQIKTHCEMYECRQAKGPVCCEQCADFPCDKMWREDVFVLSRGWLEWMKETMASDTGVIEQLADAR